MAEWMGVHQVEAEAVVNALVKNLARLNDIRFRRRAEQLIAQVSGVEGLNMFRAQKGPT